MPCIVGAWGYHLPPMGVEKMQQHWRYMIARWGAWPVVWCLAGELTMPFWPPRTAGELEDLSKRGLTIADRRKQDSAFQKSGWTDVARYIRKNDPYKRLLTLHPQAMRSCRDQIDDPSLLDFELLQTNHDDWWGTPSSLGLLVSELEKAPRMPVMIGEVAYEGLQQHNRQEVVRFGFWSAILSGEAGHTYGAGGIFEMESAKNHTAVRPMVIGIPTWMSLGTLPPNFPGRSRSPGARNCCCNSNGGGSSLIRNGWSHIGPKRNTGCLTERPSRESCLLSTCRHCCATSRTHCINGFRQPSVIWIRRRRTRLSGSARLLQKKSELTR